MRANSNHVLLITAFFAALSGAAHAQTSSATFSPVSLSKDTSPATPAKPLEILDTDYPLGALLENEEGRVTLNLLIDEKGVVSYAQVLQSSGSVRLDLAAAQTAKAKWSFKPATNGGAAVPGSARAEVIWNFPLRPADEFYSQMMGIPVMGRSVSPPSGVPGTHALRRTDYPDESIKNRENGEVALRVRVLADGKIGDVELVETSGFPRLDQSAISAVKTRYQYTPGRVDGVPVEMNTDVLIGFAIGDTRRDLLNQRFCHGRAFIGAQMQVSSTVTGDSTELKQWVHLVRDGSIDDILLLTKKGWMHYSAAFIAATNANRRKTPLYRVREAPGMGSLIAPSAGNFRRDDCWFNGDVTVKGN